MSDHMLCPDSRDDLTAVEVHEYGLRDHMNLCAYGTGWVPGSIDGNPMYVATWLEYGRRGGGDQDELSDYRVWLAENATLEWLVRVMEIGAGLERLTAAGACWDCFAAYLDPMLDVMP